ncbi:MAG: circularly permuted type 2 ATP-grasp protein [Mycobacterium sp.]
MISQYRSARAQGALFEVGRRGSQAGYDEFLEADGTVRPAWADLADAIAQRGRPGLDRLLDRVRALVDTDGITYMDLGRGSGSLSVPDAPAHPVPWRLDGLPLLVDPADWNTLEVGLTQRATLLDAILSDVYGPQELISSGALPPQLFFAHPGYVRAAHGIALPGRHQLFLLGCDISRAGTGDFRVNGDWTQAPSGAGYAIAGRRVVAHAAPDLYEKVAPRPTSPFAQTLRLALIDVAPESVEDPVVVVLSPGIHSETSFDQAYLASVLGFPLVESADLVVREGKLWMRSLGTLRRVDVVLRRVDADYSDPLDLRADSRLGVVGLVEVLRRGAVTVVNSLGSGVLENPGLARFLPELSQRLLDEPLGLSGGEIWWGGIDAERSHLLANLDSLLVKSTVGDEVHTGPLQSVQALETLRARIEAAPWHWVGQELPELSLAPTYLRPGALTAAPVGMRLFTVAQRGGYAPMIGGLGYAAASGYSGSILNSFAAKDIWVQQPDRDQTERALTVAPADLPAARLAGSDAVSSPRVLSDLFWLGRYGERAENLVRLLAVTRERFHEYRYRQFMEASECVPALLKALGDITGTRADDLGSQLWSLTVDKERAGSLAQSVERLGLSARAVRDQMSNDTWMVLGGMDRAIAAAAAEYDDYTRSDGGTTRADDTVLAATQTQVLAGLLALSGLATESTVHDIGWTMMDIGKRIERGLGLTALLRSTLTTVRGRAAEQSVTESTLVACESSVIYRRRTRGKISLEAVADLLLFDADNPRSLLYQVESLRTDLKSLPSASGTSRPERLVEDLVTQLRRIVPADLDAAGEQGQRDTLAETLDSVHQALRELSTVVAATHLSMPTGMQPLWGPDTRRRLP